MKKRLLLLLLAVVAIISVLAAVFAYTFYKADMNIIEMELKVREDRHIGLDINETALKFGIMYAGSRADRNVIIENNKDYPLNAHVFIRGNITKFVSFQERFVLDKNGNKSIGFSAYIPEGTAEGDYNGEAVFILRRKWV